MRHLNRTTAALKLAAFLAALVSLGGCATVEGLLGGRPTASVAGVSLQDVGLSAATLLFDVEVTNPYAAPLPLVNLDYQLASSAQPFLSGKADLQGTVPARGARTVSLPARVSYADLLKVLRGVTPGSVVPYDAELGLSVDVPAAGPLRLPIRKSGKLPVPAAPEVSVREIKWTDLSLEKAAGLVKLDIVNRNKFPVDLSRIDYALSLGGAEVGRSALARPVAMAAGGGSGAVEIPLEFSPRQLGLGVFRVLTGAAGGYKLGGSMEVTTPFGPMTLPLDAAGQTLFRR